MSHEVLTVLQLKTQVWDVILHCYVTGSWQFKGLQCLYLRHQAVHNRFKSSAIWHQHK